MCPSKRGSRRHRSPGRRAPPRGSPPGRVARPVRWSPPDQNSTVSCPAFGLRHSRSRQWYYLWCGVVSRAVLPFDCLESTGCGGVSGATSPARHSRTPCRTWPLAVRHAGTADTPGPVWCHSGDRNSPLPDSHSDKLGSSLQVSPPHMSTVMACSFRPGSLGWARRKWCAPHPWQRTPNAGWRQVSKPGRQQQCYTVEINRYRFGLEAKPPNHEIHAAQLASVAQAIAPGNVAVLPARTVNSGMVKRYCVPIRWTQTDIYLTQEYVPPSYTLGRARCT